MDGATSTVLPPPTAATSAENGVATELKAKELVDVTADYTSLVDPFLVEALQNPRHRLTILRMELEVQKFLQNSELQQFEFQHFPTSYLRLAAHRVAQHYGLQTMVLDNIADSQGTRILVLKKAESKYPAICLTDIPLKQSENDKFDQIKVVLKPRSGKNGLDGGSDLGLKRNHMRTVEERKEEYDRARARIFNESASELVNLDQVSSNEKNLFLSLAENEAQRNSAAELGKHLSTRENSTSRVAIFRDREKDLSDPDYDRNYQRYTKNVNPTQSFSLTPFNVQKFQHPYPPPPPYNPLLHQLGHIPRSQPSLSYASTIMSPFGAAGLNQISRDGMHTQWPTQSMIYAHSYDQLRHAFAQAPICQQPLSFDYLHNHW